MLLFSHLVLFHFSDSLLNLYRNVMLRDVYNVSNVRETEFLSE